MKTRNRSCGLFRCGLRGLGNDNTGGSSSGGAGSGGAGTMDWSDPSGQVSYDGGGGDSGKASGATTPAGGGLPFDYTNPDAWVQAGRDVVSTAQQGAAVVDAVLGQNQPASKSGTVYTLDPARVKALQRTVRVAAPSAASNQNVPAYDAGLNLGISGQDIVLIAGVAGLAGLGYWLLTKGKGKRRSRSK